jgi:SAM-dependent methyltransferase
MIHTITREIAMHLADLQYPLNREATNLYREGRGVAEFGALLAEHAPTTMGLLDSAYAALSEQASRYNEEEQREAAAMHRMLVQPFFLASPLVRRVLDGTHASDDYVAMEMLHENVVAGGPPMSQLVSAYALSCGPCRSRRAQVRWAGERMQRLAEQQGALRVLSFSCGPERVLRALSVGDVPCDLTLSDADPRALVFAEQQLRADWRARGLEPLALRSVELGVQILIKDFAQAYAALSPAREPFDVILLFGVLDHLTDDVAQRLLSALGRLLGPSGELLLSAPHRENPWRTFTEYVMGWRVEQRDLGSVRDLLAGAGMEGLELSPDPDSGCMLLCAARGAPA